MIVTTMVERGGGAAGRLAVLVTVTVCATDNGTVGGGSFSTTIDGPKLAPRMKSAE